MIFEKIPEKVKIGSTILNLQTENLPKDLNGDVMATTFEVLTTTNDNYPTNMGLVVILKMKESKTHPTTGMDEEIEGTSIRIVFKGGKWSTKNRTMMQLVMGCSGYKKEFSIDPEDPSGYWRATGAIKVEIKPIITRAIVKPPNFDDIDDKNLIDVGVVTKDEDGNETAVIEPVHVIK